MIALRPFGGPSRRTSGGSVAITAGSLKNAEKSVCSHGLILSGIGIGIGIAVAAGLARLMASLLFNVSPLDVVTYVAVSLVLASAAVLASYLPARRAAALDPVRALRAE